MTLFHAILLSVVEGVTEFLPISSTGHMILAVRALNIPVTEFTKSFEIIIQLGAVLAIVFLYAKRLFTEKKSWLNICIAFLPSGIVGFVLYKTIKQYLLGNPLIVVVALFAGGIVLILIEKYLKPKDVRISNLTIPKALSIGLFQTISMIPGVSRSGATIVGGLLMGLSKKEAVEFSFLLAVPTMAAATGYDIIKSSLSFSPWEIQLLSVGFIGAFITALIAVKSFVSFVQKHSLFGFGVYRIILAILYWILIIKG
jgi:undecaprenyl-diphosphatase